MCWIKSTWAWPESLRRGGSDSSWLGVELNYPFSEDPLNSDCVCTLAAILSFVYIGDAESASKAPSVGLAEM